MADTTSIGVDLARHLTKDNDACLYHFLREVSSAAPALDDGVSRSLRDEEAVSARPESNVSLLILDPEFAWSEFPRHEQLTCARQRVVVTFTLSSKRCTTIPPSRSVRKTRTPNCRYLSSTFGEGCP